MSVWNVGSARFGARRLVLLVLGAAAGMVMAASVAYACGPSATMGLDTVAGAPGATVTGAGYNFSKAGEAGLTDATAELHWNTRDGAVLWSGQPAEDGSLDIAFTVPNVAPGHYLVILYQQSEAGVTPGRQPARARFEVLAAGASASVAPASATESAVLPAPAQPAPAPEHVAPAPVPAPAAAAPAAAVTQDRAPLAPAAATDSAHAVPPARAAEPAAAVPPAGPAVVPPAMMEAAVTTPTGATTWSPEVIAALQAATVETPAAPVPGLASPVARASQATVAIERSSSSVPQVPVSWAAALGAALAVMAAYAVRERRRRAPAAPA